MCMSGCITFLQALWGCRYLFTLVLHVVTPFRSLHSLSSCIFDRPFINEWKNSVCCCEKPNRHFHGRPIAGQKSVLYKAFPPADTLWYVLFSLALLCSNIIKDSKHGGFCSKHLWVSEEPQLKRCTGFAPVPRLFEESASGRRIDKQMSTSLKRTPSKILRCKVWCGEVDLYL